LNALSVFEFSKLGRALLVHFLLDDASLLSIALVNLLEDISLMVLLLKSVSLSFVLSFSLDSLNLLIDKLLLILEAPLVLISHH